MEFEIVHSIPDVPIKDEVSSLIDDIRSQLDIIETLELGKYRKKAIESLEDVWSELKGTVLFLTWD